MTATIYPIPPGIYCVPAAIVALTGADLCSVVLPALNRAQAAGWLLGPVQGVRVDEAERALGEMGWVCRRSRDHSRRSQLRTWARLSAERYPGRRLLVATRDHALVVLDGKVYDTFTPYGGEGAAHPFARDTIVYVALVQEAR